jgi:hypothetical protein
MDDKKLEALLARQIIEPPSAGLADRIIAAIYPRPVAEPISATLRRIFAEFLPRPAYALAAALLLGAVLGFGFTPDASYAQDSYYEDGGF